jgi:hypothetical protein
MKLTQFIEQYSMAKYKLFPQQLKSLQKAITEINNEVTANINYKLDYVKLFVHPELNNFIVLKSRTHGISAGMPYDEIKYMCFNSDGKLEDIRKNFINRNAWYTFVSDLREVKLVGGQVEFI